MTPTPTPTMTPTPTPTPTPRYTGSGAYCYANSLHMCLQAAGATGAAGVGDALPEPGFLECLTTMPFGAGYLRLEGGGFALPRPITVDPDAGGTRALDALGWACEEWSGDDAREALDRLCVSSYFPLGARRRLDGARFFREAGLPEAAAILDNQAMLWGRAQTLALAGAVRRGRAPGRQGGRRRPRVRAPPRWTRRVKTGARRADDPIPPHYVAMLLRARPALSVIAALPASAGAPRGCAGTCPW